jgi:hypothetical protein
LHQADQSIDKARAKGAASAEHFAALVSSDAFFEVGSYPGLLLAIPT